MNAFKIIVTNAISDKWTRVYVAQFRSVSRTLAFSVVDEFSDISRPYDVGYVYTIYRASRRHQYYFM